MAAIVLALAFCLLCSWLVRAPLAVLYIVGIPLAMLIGLAALYAISPLLFFGAIVLGFCISLDRFLSRRR